MTARKKRHLLVLANLGLALGIGAAVALGIFVPLDSARVVQPPEGQGKASDARLDGKTQPLAAYAAAAQRDLARPLFDPPPAPPASAVRAPAPQCAVRLVGTAVEPGFTYAIFRTTAGRDKLVSVGETIEGVTVTAVAAGSVTVRLGGQLLALKVERADAPLPDVRLAAAQIRQPVMQPPQSALPPQRETEEASPATVNDEEREEGIAADKAADENTSDATDDTDASAQPQEQPSAPAAPSQPLPHGRSSRGGRR